jgi:glutamate racemase
MIGIFDSGLGGLTVAKEIFKLFPSYPLLYFGDTANLPYGLKPKHLVKEYSEEAVNWIKKKGANLIVIACHTSSCLAGDYLKEKFYPFPIIDMIASTVKAGVNSTHSGRIGIIGTPSTIESGVYQKKLQEENSNLKIYSQACPLLVPLVEEGWENKKMAKRIIQKYLLPLRSDDIDALILGCTHYPLLIKAIQETMGENVKLVDPAVEIAQTLEPLLDRNQDSNPESKKKKDTHQFFFSAYPYNFGKISQKCLGQEISPKTIFLHSEAN